MYQLPVAIRMVRVDKAEHKQPPYLAINPLGKVRWRAATCVTPRANARSHVAATHTQRMHLPTPYGG
jgi:hypothetical protein